LEEDKLHNFMSIMKINKNSNKIKTMIKAISNKKKIKKNKIIVLKKIIIRIQ